MKNLVFLFLIFINFFCSAQQKEITDYVKTESNGGKLDFTKVAEEQAQGAYFIRFDNVLYNKKDFAILLWGTAVKSLGIEKIEEAVKLWEEINKRLLTEAEKKALKTGFETKIED